MNPKVDQYIDDLPEPLAEVASAIRNYIFHNIAGVEERYSFKLPFYHYYGMFCYMNRVKGGLEICFCRGKDLAVAFPQLEQKERKLIAGITLRSKKEIVEKEIFQLLEAGAAWNKECFMMGTPLVSKKRGRK